MTDAFYNKLEKIHDLFETDLIEQPFMKKLFGFKNLDYKLDSTNRPRQIPKYTAYIEFLDVSNETMTTLDADYKSFLKSFSEWADKHRLTDADIMSENETMAILFSVGF